MKSCYKYFSAILSAIRKIKIFKFPDWIPTLNPPLHPCLTTPPSYQEVTKAIRKSKSKSSPGPLDHISVICFKKGPILRTILHKIISECWSHGEIPSCWRKGPTILIYKKGDASDPSNFRQITSQTVPYKILSSIIRNRMYSFLEENNYIDKHVQKGFWPRIDGVAEHTQVLTNLMKDAKRNQRSIVVTLLDLKNAFGEINHKLIISALRYHHIPSEITNLIKNIYSNCQISIATGTQNTPLINVAKGVLQGDPCSPLIFNICFNPLMKLISQPKYEQLGYLWGPNARVRSWLQFADDTTLISKNVKAAQSLIDLNVAWCKWSGMEIRTDKCITFGMRKQDSVYVQFQPNLTIDNEAIPQVESNRHFTYLGKQFDFDMKNESVKSNLHSKLSGLLKKNSRPKCVPATEIKNIEILHTISTIIHFENLRHSVHMDFE